MNESGWRWVVRMQSAVQRKLHRDGGALTGAGSDRELPAAKQCTGSAHPHQPEMALAGQIGRLIRRGEAATVVADHEREVFRGEGHIQPDVAGLRVGRHVGERLLDDAIGRQLDVGSQPNHLVGTVRCMGKLWYSSV